MLWTILIGFIVGVIAKKIKLGNDHGGFIKTTILGIAGSFVVTFIANALHLYPEGRCTGIIALLICATLLLLIYRLAVKNSDFLVNYDILR